MTVLLLTSCFKDEAKNAECDILSVWVEGYDYKDCFYQPETDMRQDNVLASNSHIVFNVKSLLSLPDIPLQFTLTPGATIVPANGTAQNFRNGPVTYKVTSEDGAWTRTYTVEFREADMPKLEFDFENYEITDGNMLFFSYKYYSWFEYDRSGNKRNVWATGNQGFGMGNSNLSPDEHPTVPIADGYEGNCVRMRTLSAGPLAEAMKKYMAAGNLFIGAFDVNKALSSALESTLMGKDFAFPANPLRVTGYYKYTPGAEYRNGENKVVPGKTDEADIYAVLYRNKDKDGNAVVLDGGNVLTSEYVVSKARVKSLPPTDTWQPFEMFFEEIKPIDDELLGQFGYNLALVFSSSKDGALFCGAIGSTLYIDKVEISLEKNDGEEEKQQ
jgi:hypothetical protein